MNSIKMAAAAIFSLFIIAMMVPVSTEAAVSLGANPSSLETSIARSGSAQIDLSIFNTGTDGINCNLYVDDNYSSWVSFSESTFYLDGEARKDIKITIVAPLNGTDDNEFNVFIVGSSSYSNGTPVSAGLRIPVSVSLTSATSNGISIIAVFGLVMVSMIGLVALVLFIKRK